MRISSIILLSFLLVIILVVSTSCFTQGAEINPFQSNQMIIEESQCEHIDGDKIITYPTQTVIQGSYRKGEVGSSKSMIPTFFDKSILLYSEDKENLCIGDMVQFEPKKAECKNFINDDIPVVHRIIGIKEDTSGKIYITKGDKNDFVDNCNLRYEDISYVVVGVLY